jgi:hypothetical protein
MGAVAPSPSGGGHDGGTLFTAPGNPSDYLVRNHRRLVFFTGTGMPAESGVPTYRGKGGVWKEYETCASQQALDRDPARVWEFPQCRRNLVAARKPNRGHPIIAGVEAAQWNGMLDRCSRCAHPTHAAPECGRGASIANVSLDASGGRGPGCGGG